MKIGIMLLILLFAATAEAQTIAVDINRAALQWVWTQGTAPNDGVPSEWHIKCGQTSGSYSKITVVQGVTTRNANVKDVIAGLGNWFCVVTGANQFGETQPSNEVPFVAGAGPVGSVSLSVMAQ